MTLAGHAVAGSIFKTGIVIAVASQIPISSARRKVERGPDSSNALRHSIKLWSALFLDFLKDNWKP